MELSIRGRHLELSEPLKRYASRRLEFAVGTFASRISGIALSLTDVNGPRGGIDKRCVIRIVLQPLGRVFVHAMDSDAYAAIDRAATRIRSVVARKLARRRGLRHREVRLRG